MSEKTELEKLNICVALLAQHNKIHYVVIAITTATIVLIMMQGSFVKFTGMTLLLATTVVILGLLETFIAVRVGFDQLLLSSLCQESISDTNPTLNLKIEHLDIALTQLRLMPGSKAGRDLNARLQGCIKLFKQQALLCGLQVLVILAASVLGTCTK